jgi:hypothetical protein
LNRMKRSIFSGGIRVFNGDYNESLAFLRCVGSYAYEELRLQLI